MVNLLSDIKEKLPVYAFSNTNLTHMSAWSEMFAQVLPLFRKVFVSCEMGMRKPEPEAFNAVTREIGVKPEHILFFDDSVENISGAGKIRMILYMSNPLRI